MLHVIVFFKLRFKEIMSLMNSHPRSLREFNFAVVHRAFEHLDGQAS